MTDSTESIRADFPFESRFVEVNGSEMHYIDEGQGEVILFLHGVPTSSYLWRNVIPYLTDTNRVIALDLIGFGQSAKPKADYHVKSHIDYVSAFIDKLELKNIVLVMHGWGGVIGFSLAMANQDNFRGLAFLETHIRANDDWDMVSLPVQELAQILSQDDGGYDTIVNTNYYVDKVFPKGILRTLSAEEMEAYRQPFNSPESREPIWQYLQDLPLGHPREDVLKLINTYSRALCESSIPKLMMYAVPGFITTMETVAWTQAHLKNLTLQDIGDALHYAQESKPETIGTVLGDWLREI